MKKFILGIIVGILIFIFFVFFSGGDYLKELAMKTDKAGSEVINYEQKLKKKVKEVKEKAAAVKETIDDVKKRVAP